jgi:tetratricopeptide (TPR) repeat protein
MIRLLKIGLLTFICSLFISAQGQFENCPEKVLLIKYYKEKDYNKAKLMLDSVLAACPSQKENPYYWHLSGFIHFDIFKYVDNRSPISKARTVAIESFKKSLDLDKKEEYIDNNTTVLDYLSNSYYNDAVLYVDTVHFDEAETFFNKYKSLKRLIHPDYNFDKKDIDFNNAMASIYRMKYINNKKHRTEYLDKAIKCYEKTLSIDSINYSANYNSGIIYHNLGVDLILDELADDAELEKVIMMEEKAIQYFSTSLPFLKRAYSSKPNDKSIIQGIVAVYYSLNEMENYVKYANILKKLNAETQLEKNN